MIIDRVRAWKRSRASSGWRRRVAGPIAVGLSVLGVATFLSACAATPDFFSATANGDGTITLSWADVSNDGFFCPNFDGYAVYMSTTPGGEDTTGAPLNAFLTNGEQVTTTQNTYKVTGLQPGTTYYFVVLTIGQLPNGTTTCIAAPSTEESATTVSQHVADGPVQVSLEWDTTADLDLHVAEPDLTEIYYGNTTSADGGTYGIDANGGCENTTTSPVETVNWTNPPPSGTYTAKVIYFSECDGGTGPQSFTITVTVRGQVILERDGTINAPGDELDYSYSV